MKSVQSKKILNIYRGKPGYESTMSAQKGGGEGFGPPGPPPTAPVINLWTEIKLLDPNVKHYTLWPICMMHTDKVSNQNCCGNTDTPPEAKYNSLHLWAYDQIKCNSNTLEASPKLNSLKINFIIIPKQELPSI